MTNRIALILALVLVAAFIADLVFFRWGASLFLARKFLGLVDWAMFWR